VIVMVIVVWYLIARTAMGGEALSVSALPQATAVTTAAANFGVVLNFWHPSTAAGTVEPSSEI